MDNSPDTNQALARELEKQKQRVRELEQLLGKRGRQESLYRSDLSRLGQAFQPAKIRAWFWENETRLTHYLPVEADVQDSWGQPAKGTFFTEDRLLQAIYRDDQEHLASAWNRAYEDHTTYDVEYRIVAGDGTVRHQHEIATPEFDETGRYVGHIGTTQDITEQKLAEEALKQNANLLTEAERVANIGHWKFDDEGYGLLSCSEQAAAIFGLSTDEFLASASSHEGFLRLVLPDDRTLVDNAVNAYYHQFQEDPEHAKPLELEYRIVRTDGAIRHIRERAGPTVNDQNVISRSVGTVQDITGHKELEAALRESEKRYRTIFDTATAGIGRTLLKDGSVILSNQKLAQVFGYDSVDAFVSEFVFSEHYADSEDRARLMSSYKDSPGTAIECTFTKKDGTPVIVQAHAIANYEEGILDFVATDITDQKLAE